ncbi:hypothetical protein BH10CYA1_BH10CYA1_43550 [soil metagenome]
MKDSSAEALTTTSIDTVIEPSAFQRVGVVRRRTLKYSSSQTAQDKSKGLARIVFEVRLDGGIGSEVVTFEQALDAITTLILEGDQVCTRVNVNGEKQSMVSPIFNWAAASAENIAKGRVLRTGNFLDVNGVPSVASLLLLPGVRDLMLAVTPLVPEAASTLE